MPDFTRFDTFIYWIIERVAMQRRRTAGEYPLTADPILAAYRFCNVNVSDDRVSRYIFDNITRPLADHPQLIVALTIARCINEPEVIEAVRDCLPPTLNFERFVAVMQDRKARDLPLARRAYRIPGPPGEQRAVGLTRTLFAPLAEAAEQVGPHPGDTVAAVFERLSTFPYLGKGFLCAQIVRDLKQAGPLRAAPDWKTFVRSGPGSRQCINLLLGGDIMPDSVLARLWREPVWRRLFWMCVERAMPIITDAGIEIEDAQSWQNCFCETAKLIRYLMGDFGGARKYEPKE
jgi:hypothetical protein